MTVEEQINREFVQALKRRDRVVVSTLRLLKAAAHNAEVAKRAPLSEAEYQQVLAQQAKLRRDAIAEYERAGRTDLADQERAELSVLQQYLPEPMNENELRAVIRQAIAESGATGPSDMGQVMALVMPQVRGRAEGATVSRLVRQMLATS